MRTYDCTLYLGQIDALLERLHALHDSVGQADLRFKRGSKGAAIA